MKRLRMAREAVAETVDYVPELIRFDAPIFRGASRAAQELAVREVGGRGFDAGSQIGGHLLNEGSVQLSDAGHWLIPGVRNPGEKGDELRARARRSRRDQRTPEMTNAEWWAHRSFGRSSVGDDSTCPKCGGGLPPCAGCDYHAYPCECSCS